ncbi:reduced folate carrier [Ancylostoma duodenale]|uniref:Reduced folate carrier n=1 Tax=Ancylostoma duodenale TaxID=51022 RepID=A0A0C2G839_9BILA|nr:reduced folate carrier [Ancylostoma duodenale]
MFNADSKWIVTTILLCSYGFLKEFRPTEPFLYQYEHETLNISEHTLNAEILEFFYGWATATEIAYFAYIYMNVSKDKFKRVTSYTRGALLFGRFLGYSVAQLIILMKWGTYQTLNIISLAALCIALIGNYTQTLWGTIIEAKNTEVYNGVTEALCPLIGLPIVILVQYLRVDWSRWGELCLAACSLLDALVLLLLAKTNSLLVMYIGYVVYRVLYQAMITIAQFNLADSLETASYGLVFGLNTFIALVLQSILTLVVTSSFGLALSIRPQFEVYSGCHFVVTAIFIIPPIYRCCRKCFTTKVK